MDAPFRMCWNEKSLVAQCVTCGSELHPERAEKYDYCMAPECQEKNLKGLTMVAVGVNKSAEQYLLLDEETRDELARGKYHDQRRGSFGTSVPSQASSPAEATAPAQPRRPGPRPPGQSRPARSRGRPRAGRGPSPRRDSRCSTTSKDGGRKRSRRSSA